MKEKEISTTTETKNVTYIVDEVESFLKDAKIPEDIIEDIIIVVDEAVTNIIMYSYENKEDVNNKIICKLRINDKSIVIEIHDFGEYSPDINSIKKPHFDINGNKVGGFGLYIINNFMDELKFIRDKENSENILSMKKYL